ncbi:MAG: hypothetical protein NZL96_01600 [Patescibacteria group bacterium]|nr:hypothetical protein [Patescibacteria group bacterium]
MNNFFYYFSKGAIFLSVVIIIFALLTRSNKKEFENNLQTKATPSVSILPSLFSQKDSSPSADRERFNFDFNTHWLCRYRLENEEYKIELRDKKINLEIKNLINNTSQRYDLSYLLPLVENFFLTSFIQLEDLFKLFPEIDRDKASPESGLVNLSFGDFLKNCQKINK